MNDSLEMGLVMKQEMIVKCNADFGFDGKLTPRTITWPDGSCREISSILESKPFETWTGKAGVVFKCEVEDEILDLYYNHRLNVWFFYATFTKLTEASDNVF